MEFTGTIKSYTNDSITLSTEDNLTIECYDLMDLRLTVKVSRYRAKRSLDANAYLWVLLQKMAEVLLSDKWAVYLQMLKKYGQFTYIVVKPNAVDGVKRQWRECEEIGEVNINGTSAVQMLCYYGSSAYDTKEMSVLIDGVVGECQELGIDTISPDEIRMMKERWGV